MTMTMAMAMAFLKVLSLLPLFAVVLFGIGVTLCVYTCCKEGGDGVDEATEEEEEEESDGYNRFTREYPKQVRDNVAQYVEVVHMVFPVFVEGVAEFERFDSTSNTSHRYHQDRIYNFYCTIADGLMESMRGLSTWKCFRMLIILRHIFLKMMTFVAMIVNLFSISYVCIIDISILLVDVAFFVGGIANALKGSILTFLKARVDAIIASNKTDVIAGVDADTLLNVDQTIEDVNDATNNGISDNDDNEDAVSTNGLPPAATATTPPPSIFAAVTPSTCATAASNFTSNNGDDIEKKSDDAGTVTVATEEEQSTASSSSTVVDPTTPTTKKGKDDNDETGTELNIASRTRTAIEKKAAQKEKMAPQKLFATKEKVAPKKKITPQKSFKDYNSQLTVDSSDDDEGSLWNKNYNRLLKRFKSRGHSVVTELDPDQHLYQWYGQQKEKRTEGKLPSWKVKKLSPLKFCWNEVDKEWDATCKELMLHHKQNPNSGPPAHLVPWALDLRKAYNDGSITREHEDALQEIDPYFFIRRPISTVPTTSTNSNTDTDFAAAAPTATASIQYGGGLGLMPLRDSNSNNESKEEEEVADDGIPIANDENTDIGEELNNDKVEEGKKGPVSVPPTPIIKKERRRGYTKDVTARPEDYYAAIITFRSPTFKHMSHKAFCESPHSGPNITGSLSHQNSFRRYFGLQKTGKFKNPLGADEGVHVPKVQTPTQTTKDVFDFPGKDNSNTTSARTHRRSLPRRNKRKRDTGSTQRVLRSSKVKKNKNTAVGNAMTKKRKKK